MKIIILIFKKINIENYKDYKVEFRSDKRFKIFKKLNSVRKFDHKKRILFLLLNKKAHELYKIKFLNYNSIVDFIFNNLDKFNYNYKLSNFDDIIKYYGHTKLRFNKNLIRFFHIYFVVLFLPHRSFW